MWETNVNTKQKELDKLKRANVFFCIFPVSLKLIKKEDSSQQIKMNKIITEI